MKISHIFSTFLLFTIPVSEKLMAAEIAGRFCPMVGQHQIKLPNQASREEGDPTINAITCGEEPNTVQIHASMPYVEKAYEMPGVIEKAHSFLITLKPLSRSFSLPFNTTLKSIYNPKNYADANSTPLPKVVADNGLTYVKGRQTESHERVDFYLKPDKKGNTDMAIYCYLSDGVQDARNCMMGFADKDLSLDVVVKISESEIGDYKNIKQSVSEIIDSIIDKRDTSKKDVIFRLSQEPGHVGA